MLGFGRGEDEFEKGKVTEKSLHTEEKKIDRKILKISADIIHFKFE